MVKSSWVAHLFAVHKSNTDNTDNLSLKKYLIIKSFETTGNVLEDDHFIQVNMKQNLRHISHA